MTDAELEELLNLAKSEKTTYENSGYTDIEYFIIDCNIQPSETERVDILLIHWYYIKWCISKKIKPLFLDNFGKYFIKRFKRYKAERRRQYYVKNSDQFNVSQDELWQIRKYHREYRMRKVRSDARQKAKKKKKQCETSRSKKTI